MKNKARCYTVACPTCLAKVEAPCRETRPCPARVAKARKIFREERAAQVSMFKTEDQVSDLIDEKDAYRDTVSEVHSLLGCDLPWNVEHAHDECVRKLVAELIEEARAPF